MSILHHLSCEKIRLQHYEADLQENLSHSPEGEFRIHKNRGSDRWRIYQNQKWESVPKSKKKLVQQLILKKFWQNELARTRGKLRLLEPLIEAYASIESEADPYGLVLDESRAESRRELLEWGAGAYECKLDHPEGKSILTNAGIYVRSKSEAMIANELFARGIPFHYEEKLDLAPSVLYPDFVIRSPRDPEKVIIWEHFGLMERQNYVQIAKGKISLYLDAGYIPGDNLILTFEQNEQPLDINTVQLMITTAIL